MGFFSKTGRNVGRGVSGYFSMVGRGAKGAVAWESVKQSGQLAGSLAQRLRLKSCPRCLEMSLVEDVEGYRCMRADICGLHGSKEEIAAFAAQSRADPRVVAIAKGFSGNFTDRSKSARIVSRLLWVFAACIVMYSLSWMFESRWLTAVWSFLVAVLCSVQAIRYAYAVQRLLQPLAARPLQFLLSPAQWFV